MVDVVVHYGAGNVGVNESGVDLSEFGNMLIQLTDPVNLRIAAIQQYFTINFRFDPNIWAVKIQSVWSKSRTNIFRELLPLDRTSQWTSWLASCKRRGTQPEILLVFNLKENNLEHGGGGPEHGESSQCTGSENVDLFGSMEHISDNYEPALSSQSAGPAHEGEADGDEYAGTL